MTVHSSRTVFARRSSSNQPIRTGLLSCSDLWPQALPQSGNRAVRASGREALSSILASPPHPPSSSAAAVSECRRLPGQRARRADRAGPRRPAARSRLMAVAVAAGGRLRKTSLPIRLPDPLRHALRRLCPFRHGDDARHGGGNARVLATAAHDPHGVDERKAVRVLVHLARRLMDQTPHGVMRQHQPMDLLQHQIRRLAQDRAGPQDVGLDLVVGVSTSQRSWYRAATSAAGATAGSSRVVAKR